MTTIPFRAYRRRSSESFHKDLIIEALTLYCEGLLYPEMIIPRFRPDNEYGDKRLTPSVNFLTSYSIPIHKTLSCYPPEVLQTLFLPFDEGHLSRAGHNVVGKCMVDFLTPRIAANSGE